jgi:hypothetical protein
MIVSINQPAYLPWTGYFHRIAISDRHVVLNHVQFEKNSFTNRNKVRTSAGWTWLTIPIETRGKFGNLPINELTLAGGLKWQQKHWRTICQNYSKAPYFSLYASELEHLYTSFWTSLDALCAQMMRFFLDALGIITEIQFSAEMKPCGKKNSLILDLCKKSKANIYLSGTQGQNYLKEAPFKSSKIKVVYQDYKHPIYTQHQKGNFEAYMGIIDLLFNCGPGSLEVLMKDQMTPKNWDLK